jgi:hypothetical protein
VPIFGGDAYGNFTDFIEINECAPDTTGAGRQDASGYWITGWGTLKASTVSITTIRCSLLR